MLQHSQRAIKNSAYNVSAVYARARTVKQKIILLSDQIDAMFDFSESQKKRDDWKDINQFHKRNLILSSNFI